MQIRVTEILDDKKVAQQEKRWNRAIANMGRVVPFWAYHAERLELTMCRGWNNTAAVDGVRLYWNPEFTAGLTDKQLMFLLTHEVFHVAAGHIWRGERYLKGKVGAELHREASTWNMAADYAIHQTLVPLIDSGYYDDLEFIKSGLYDVKYSRQSAETIYRDLKANPPKQDEKGDPCTNGTPSQGGADGGGSGEGAPADGDGGQQVLDVHIMRGDGDAPEGALEDQDGSWVLIVDQNGNPVKPDEGDPAPEATNTKGLRRQISREIADAKLEKEGYRTGRGTGWAEINAKVEAEGKTKQNWDVLKRFILQCAQSDYSYNRPNRTYLSRNMIIPGLRSGALKIKIAIDTSSSVSKSLLNRFGVEVEQIRSQLGDHEIEIITCSTHIPKDADGREKTQVVRTGEDINWSIVRGGGTSFVPVFKYVQEQGDSPACLLYFTDLDGSFPQFPPDYPVLWAVPDKCTLKAPFGEIVKLSTE